jgi:hypothetical protein
MARIRTAAARPRATLTCWSLGARGYHDRVSASWLHHQLMRGVRYHEEGSAVCASALLHPLRWRPRRASLLAQGCRTQHEEGGAHTSVTEERSPQAGQCRRQRRHYHSYSAPAPARGADTVGGDGHADLLVREILETRWMAGPAAVRAAAGAGAGTPAASRSACTSMGP